MLIFTPRTLMLAGEHEHSSTHWTLSMSTTTLFALEQTSTKVNPVPKGDKKKTPSKTTTKQRYTKK